MYTDPISDFLTRVRNAMMAGHKVVAYSPFTFLRLKYFINTYGFEGQDQPQGTIKIALKYDRVTKEPAIRKIRRASSPGLRQYSGSKDLPRVLNGLGIAIISTSRGVMTDKQARQENVGGEVLCFVY